MLPIRSHWKCSNTYFANEVYLHRQMKYIFLYGGYVLAKCGHSFYLYFAQYKIVYLIEHNFHHRGHNVP